jgi:hypothetical protein
MMDDLCGKRPRQRAHRSQWGASEHDMDKKPWHWNLWALLLGPLVVAGCGQNKCQTQHAYLGNSISSGTIAYGEPAVSTSLICGSVGESGQKCMQAPDTCTGPSFGCDNNWGYVGCASLGLSVTLVRFQNGQTIALPSPDVTVVASLDGLSYTCDGGPGMETLTLVSGTVTVDISLNNFDAHYDLVFTRPDGTTVTIQDGRAALLNASWQDITSCES